MGNFKEDLVSRDYLYAEGYKIFKKYRDKPEAVQALKEIEQMILNAPKQQKELKR